MITKGLSLIFSYSILLAAVVGVWRFRKITRGDRPFFYLVWFALLSEIMGEVFTAVLRSTAVNNNIYVLGETLLTTWLFHNWKREKQTGKFKVLIVFICLVWVLDNFVLNRITHANSIFRIVASFIMVFLAIDQINQLITSERSNLLKNSRFLISAGVMIYFTYKAIVETFFWVQLPFSNTFYLYVLLIMDYVNLFVNLIFGLAALWIPTRQKFILPS